MDRKRSQVPVTDNEALGLVGDVLRTTFPETDLGSSEEGMTRLLLHLSQTPRENAQPKPTPAAAPARRRSWLRRNRPGDDGL